LEIFASGIKKERKVIAVGRGVVLGPEQIKLTSEQQKQLNISSAALANTFAGLTGAFATQSIKAEEYKKRISELSSTLPKGAAGLMLMDKILLNISPTISKASTGIADYDIKMKLLRAALVNASISEKIFQDLMSKNPSIVADFGTA